MIERIRLFLKGNPVVCLFVFFLQQGSDFCSFIIIPFSYHNIFLSSLTAGNRHSFTMESSASPTQAFRQMLNHLEVKN